MFPELIGDLTSSPISPISNIRDFQLIPSLPRFPEQGAKMTSDIIERWPSRLRRTAASRYLKEMHGIPVEPATLAKWFSQRSDGPPAHRAGRVPLYPRDALDAWATRRLGPLCSSTSANATPEGHVPERSVSNAFEAASDPDMGRCKKLRSWK